MGSNLPTYECKDKLCCYYWLNACQPMLDPIKYLQNKNIERWPQQSKQKFIY